MISSRVFSQLEFICRNLRGNDCVFGGLQVIVGGDFRQLKPVPNNAYRDPGDYCFLSDAWNCALRHVVVLDTVIRQREPVLITAIQELATGNLSPSSVSFLKSLARPLPDTCKPTYLYARNYDVMMTCYDFLCEIPGEEKSYHAVDDGELKKLSNVHVPKVLVMKKGCKVMLTVNLSTALVNGSIGTLIEMGQDHCTVNFNDVGPALIKPYCFTVFSQELGRNVASRTQLPLKLAYAITIHKAQGMTLESVVIDARHTNNAGQLATAVGRTVLSSTIQLKNFDAGNVPKQAAAVEEYYARCRTYDRPTTAHHSCCRLSKDMTICDHPLGQAPLLFDPVMEAENDAGVASDWELNLAMDDLEHSVSTEENIELGPTESRNVDVDGVRASVQSELSGAQTKSLQELYAKEATTPKQNITAYINTLWLKLISWSELSIPRGDHSRTNKDFSKLLKEFDRYSLSAEHRFELMKLFGHNANDVEMKLAFMYRKTLLNKFLSSLADDIAETHPNQPSHCSSSTSQASNAGVRYLGGMCVAKLIYKQQQLAINNIHKIKERKEVSECRCREQMLQKLVVPQQVIQQWPRNTPTNNSEAESQIQFDTHHRRRLQFLSFARWRTQQTPQWKDPKTSQGRHICICY